ncbi:putative Heat shock protein Hsp90 family [Helianthus anomalus]
MLKLGLSIDEEEGEEDVEMPALEEEGAEESKMEECVWVDVYQVNIPYFCSLVTW